MKLIRTELLLKHNNDCAVGIATASHTDYCKWKFNIFKSDIGSLFKVFIESFVMFSCLTVLMLLTPIIMLLSLNILFASVGSQHRTIQSKELRFMSISLIDIFLSLISWINIISLFRRFSDNTSKVVRINKD